MSLADLTGSQMNNPSYRLPGYFGTQVNVVARNRGCPKRAVYRMQQVDLVCFRSLGEGEKEFDLQLPAHKYSCFTMLSSMLKQHQAKQGKAREEQERRRQEALRALYKFNSAISASINNSVAVAYNNQCQIDKEMKHLQNQVGQFNRLSNQWTSMLEGFHAALKELGDVENWAKSIEEDLKTISCTLEYVNKPKNDR